MKTSKIIVRLLIIILVLSLAIVIVLPSFKPEYDEINKTFYIRNNSDKVIKGASLSFPELDYKATIPDMPPNMLCEMKIDMTVASGLSFVDVILSYTDNDGNIHEEKITDSFMADGGGGLEFYIDSINQEGLISFHKNEYKSIWSGLIINLKIGKEGLLDKLLKRSKIKVFYEIT
ncbi:MAG: hypothetical protein CVU91_05585 [Firmicutes bacterium HGW-Firmicutes-16]|nr:MAG: hypothetical protein CVU91_05585 [Firmicutes bacterium HGW-Firmicutes-16]